MGESDWETYPTCPSCGYIDEEWWDGRGGGLNHDGDTASWPCPNCDAPLTIRLCCEYTFQATTAIAATPPVPGASEGDGRG